MALPHVSKCPSGVQARRDARELDDDPGPGELALSQSLLGWAAWGAGTGHTRDWCLRGHHQGADRQTVKGPCVARIQAASCRACVFPSSKVLKSCPESGGRLSDEQVDRKRASGAFIPAGKMNE